MGQPPFQGAFIQKLTLRANNEAEQRRDLRTGPPDASGHEADIITRCREVSHATVFHVGVV